MGSGAWIQDASQVMTRIVADVGSSHETAHLAFMVAAILILFYGLWQALVGLFRVMNHDAYHCARGESFGSD